MALYSEAKRFEEVGKRLADGFADGMKDNAAGVAAQLTERIKIIADIECDERTKPLDFGDLEIAIMDTMQAADVHIESIMCIERTDDNAES